MNDTIQNNMIASGDKTNVLLTMIMTRYSSSKITDDPISEHAANRLWAQVGGGWVGEGGSRQACSQRNSGLVSDLRAK